MAAEPEGVGDEAEEGRRDETEGGEVCENEAEGKARDAARLKPWGKEGEVEAEAREAEEVEEAEAEEPHGRGA